MGLRKICEKISRRHRKRLRQLYDVLQGNIPLAPLYATHIIAMQPGPLGQLFLRVASLVTELA